jgi:hypothetical protein
MPYQKKSELVCQPSYTACRSSCGDGHHYICIVRQGQDAGAGTKGKIVSKNSFHLPFYITADRDYFYVFYGGDVQLSTHC